MAEKVGIFILRTRCEGVLYREEDPIAADPAQPEPGAETFRPSGLEADVKARRFPSPLLLLARSVCDSRRVPSRSVRKFSVWVPTYAYFLHTSPPCPSAPGVDAVGA